MMASNEEIADDAALAGQADAFSIGDTIRWLKLGQQRRSSGDVREQAEASAMLESATQGGYMFYNSFGGVACCVEIKLSRRVRIMTLRHRRDACSIAWWCSFLTARLSQDGRVIAEK